MQVKKSTYVKKDYTRAGLCGTYIAGADTAHLSQHKSHYAQLPLIQPERAPLHKASAC